MAATDGTGTTTLTGGKFLAATPETFQYDFDGNLTGDGRFTYTWDAESRLIAMETLAAVPVPARRKLAFAYDSMGRRIRKTVWHGNASGTWDLHFEFRFLHELGGWNIVAELAPDGKLLRTQTWGTDLSGNHAGAGGVGGLLFTKIIPDNSTHACGMDLNGNVTLLVSTSIGQSTATYEYGPFGETIRESGEYAKLNPFRFSTKYADDETGMVDYGHRYYIPSLGRWPSRDPIEESGGLNLYGFVDNDGLNSTDYLGLDFIAAGSRPLGGPLGRLGGNGRPANHASLEYFEENGSSKAVLNQEFTSPPEGATREATTELLQYPEDPSQLPYGWRREGWRDAAGGKGRRYHRWIETVGISGISYVKGRAKRFIVVKPCATKEDLEKITKSAENYSYAEDIATLQLGGHLSKWPNSKYEFPPNGNNSNTFVRFMLKQADIAIPEPFMGTFQHPGAYFPSPVSDSRSVPTYNPHW